MTLLVGLLLAKCVAIVFASGYILSVKNWCFILIFCCLKIRFKLSFKYNSKPKTFYYVTILLGKYENFVIAIYLFSDAIKQMLTLTTFLRLASTVNRVGVVSAQTVWSDAGCTLDECAVTLIQTWFWLYWNRRS